MPVYQVYVHMGLVLWKCDTHSLPKVQRFVK